MVVKTTLMACGFLLITLLEGRIVIPPLINWSSEASMLARPP